MSTQRRFTIVVVAVVILLLVGISTFLVYDKNASIQEVTVYELPDSHTPSVESSLSTTDIIGAITTGQRGRISDNTTEQYSSEYDQGYEAAAALGESTIEPCCPDELDPLGDMDSGQDTNLDHNPVSPEVISDARRHNLWWEAQKEHHEKVVASKEKMDELMEDLNLILDENRDSDQLLRNLRDPVYWAKVESTFGKLELLKKQDDKLAKEYPRSLTNRYVD